MFESLDFVYHVFRALKLCDTRRYILIIMIIQLSSYSWRRVCDPSFSWRVAAAAGGVQEWCILLGWFDFVACGFNKEQLYAFCVKGCTAVKKDTQDDLISTFVWPFSGYLREDFWDDLLTFWRITLADYQGTHQEGFVSSQKSGSSARC